jgi:hypothetical protein
MKNQNAEQTAFQNAKLKVEFRIHLLTYVVVNLILAAINLILTPESLWVIWPVFGWGIGLLVHAIKVRFAANSNFKERMIEKEMEKQKKASMNKVYFMISLMALSTSLLAQETQTLFNTGEQSELKYSGFGGPIFLATDFNNEIGICIGGKGGVVINETLAFGGIGFGMVNPLEFAGSNLSDDENTPLEMTYGAGGVFFEYIFNYGDRVEISVPLNLMAGGVNVNEPGTVSKVESTTFFLVEPGINIDLKISEFYTQSFFISYRQAIGSSLINVDAANISGLNVGLMFKFGG